MALPRRWSQDPSWTGWSGLSALQSGCERRSGSSRCVFVCCCVLCASRVALTRLVDARRRRGCCPSTRRQPRTPRCRISALRPTMPTSTRGCMEGSGR
eukprot:3567423-Rhodomonas_salina.1